MRPYQLDFKFMPTLNFDPGGGSENKIIKSVKNNIIALSYYKDVG